VQENWGVPEDLRPIEPQLEIWTFTEILNDKNQDRKEAVGQLTDQTTNVCICRLWDDINECPHRKKHKPSHSNAGG